MKHSLTGKILTSQAFYSFFFSACVSCQLTGGIMSNLALVKAVDGTPAIKAKQLTQLELDIFRIREGKDGNAFVIEHQNKKYGLKQMVALEKEFQSKHPNQVSQKNQFFKAALNDAHNKVQALTNSYISHARSFKRQMTTIIKSWSELRNVDTILNEWSKQGAGHELQQLKKLAPTLTMLDEFLSHLALFLKDFRESLPKTFGNLKSDSKKSGSKKARSKNEL